MKITLEVKDNKAAIFLEFIKNLKFVKKIETEREPGREEILRGLKGAVEEVKLIKAGKKKGKPIEQLLDEL